jgi:hypothetical protein
MDVRFLVVVALFVILAVVVAVGERVVIMLMSMPVGPVIPLSQRITTMVVRDVVVVVAMGASRVRVLRLAAFAFGSLYSHDCAPFPLPRLTMRMPPHFPYRDFGLKKPPLLHLSQKTTVF